MESYAYPLVVCDEKGKILFYNEAAEMLFGGQDLLGRPLPPDWMDTDSVELETEEEGKARFRLLWEEIVWDGNTAWYLVTVPGEEGEDASSEADTAELREKLEKLKELAQSEAGKRKEAEAERERLEAKLRDLHQRSVNKLEAARAALESEKSERNSLLERLTRLKEESDELRRDLDEKAQQLASASQVSDEEFRSLQTQLEEKEKALKSAEDRAERYRKVYEELDEEMTRSQEQSALLTAKLSTAEARLDRFQRLLDGEDLEAVDGAGPDETELNTLRERIKQLEGALRKARAEAAEGSDGASEGQEELQREVDELRRLVSEKDARIEELSRTESGLGGAPAGPGVDLFGAPPVAAADNLFEGASSAEPEASSQPATEEESAEVERAELAQMEQRLADAQVVIDELRAYKDRELTQAQATIRDLQSANSQLSQASNTSALETLEADLSQARSQIEQLEAALAAAAAVSDVEEDTSHWESRIAELEQELALAREQESAEAAQLKERLAQMESEFQQQASSEELEQAQQRIAELESQLSNAQQADSGADKQALEAELQQAHERLAEMAAELKRTMEGDRETKKLAYADQLTGLPNYNLTGQYLQVCFERSTRGEGALALILIDLDHFRRVNDALGQKAGDELLRQVGARLQRSVTQKDTAIARRGEDEFMVVAFLEGATADSEQLSARIRGVAHNLLSELLKPFEVMGQKVQATASLGVAIYPGPAQNREELLEQSEHAMYKAKESGRARVSFYTNDIHQHRVQKIRLEQELRRAVNEGQFALLYQPIVEVPSGKIVGIEALLRWSHPQRGLLEPREFLEVAEDTGMILPLGDLIIAEAFQVAKQKFMKRRFITLNLSHRQLTDSGFPERFMKQLQRAGVRPNDVMVEISEASTMIDPDRAKNTLAHLAHWGVGIALDDFGTGSSGLRLLRELPIRLLKIDGALVGRLPSDREASKTCLAIARLAAALDIPVLAEGVESRDQLEQIVGIGCKYAQGLFLREPVNVNHLIQIL